MGSPVLKAVRGGALARQTVLVGVSGGMDSTVLLHALAHRPHGTTLAAHVNYGLRAAESDADEAFVRATCKRWGVPLAVHRVPVASAGNRQAWARRVRYAFFRALARRHGLPVVAVAHHRDDQAETVVMKLIGGAGPDALSGMRAVRPLGPARLHRPLLHLARADLLAYAESHELAWRADASNASDAYARTHVRALLERQGGGAAVARTADLLRAQHDELIAPLVESAWAEARSGDALSVDVLRALRPALRDAVLARAFRKLIDLRPTRSHVARAAALIERQVGRRIELGPVAVWRERGALRFCAALPVPAPQKLEVGALLDWGTHRFDCGASTSEVPPGADAAAIGRDAPWPLDVRAWQPGDALRTAAGTKKVSDALTEARVPPSERAAWPVVCAGDVVVWVPGVRRALAWPLAPGARAVRVTWSQTG